jgi:fatty acid desaturase
MEASSTVGAPAGLQPDERTDEHPFIASPVACPTAIEEGQLMQTISIEARPGDFGALAAQVREAGLLRRRSAYYQLKIVATLAVFAAGWAALLVVGNSWDTLAVAALLGVMFTQLGFVGHDAGHRQVFGSRRANRWLGLAVGNALIGVSFGWWVAKHNAHHAHPNQVDCDPDLAYGQVAAGAAGEQARSGGGREAWLFFPLMLLRSTGLRVLGAQWLLRRRDRSAVTEALLIVVHTGLYLTAVFWVLSPLKAVAFIAVQQAVFSVYLGCSFAPNHKGMPIIAAESKMSFAELQVITARNVTGGWFTSLMLGGLNYQIEHHLFPTMPRPNLARAQSLIRDFCVDSDLGYAETSLVDSYRRAVNALRGPPLSSPLAPA